MMTDAQREALVEHDLTLISTMMGPSIDVYYLKARRPPARVDEPGELVVVDEQGVVHPFVDGRIGARISAAELPAG